MTLTRLHHADHTLDGSIPPFQRDGRAWLPPGTSGSRPPTGCPMARFGLYHRACLKCRSPGGCGCRRAAPSCACPLRSSSCAWRLMDGCGRAASGRRAECPVIWVCGADRLGRQTWRQDSQPLHLVRMPGRFSWGRSRTLIVQCYPDLMRSLTLRPKKKQHCSFSAQSCRSWRQMALGVILFDTPVTTI